jgi:hypothetical protein
MAHVHDPSRLVVLAGCSTVSGTVRQVLGYNPLDGNRSLLVAVDRPFRRFLRAGNGGLLAVEVIPPDAPAVRIPAVGEHATFYGAWVLDKNREHRAELHPTWRIDVAPAGATGQATTAGGAATGLGAPPTTGGDGRGFSLHVAAPASVPVGGGMHVQVRAKAEGRGRPAAEVHLFLELTSERGAGVRWAAASTNTLGVADAYLVALDAPGRFTLSVYADKGDVARVTRLPFRVTRR